MRIYGFSTQNNGCAKYRVWEPLHAIKEAGLAQVEREPDEPQLISIERCDDIFRRADIVFCQPFSELWAACIFVASRDEHKKKLVVDLDDNIWAVHHMNIGNVGGQLTYLKAHFAAKFSDCWELLPVKEQELGDYTSRIDGVVVRNDDGSYQFLHNKRPDVKLAAEFLLEHADAITTTNEPLARIIRQHTAAPVYVLPNCLDLSKWKPVPLQPGKWLGWCGSVSHYPDLKPLMPAFDRLMKRYPDMGVQIMGSSFDYLFPLKDAGKRIPISGYGVTDMFYANLEDSGERWPGRMKFSKPVPVQQFDNWIQSNWQSHVAIAPLESNEFNDAKSELKWLEYTALGVPTIASNFGPYKRAITNGEDGILVSGNGWAWESAIVELFENPEYGQRLVAAATERLHQDFDIRKRARDWMEVFECVCSSPAGRALSGVT